MKNTLYSVQVLRGIAASLVVIFHSQISLEARNIIPKVPALLDIGRAGVDLFFVISGLIMVYISGENFGKPGAPRDFLARRIIRVVPIYWIYTLFMAAFLLFLPQLVSRGKAFSSTHLMASLLFIPWENNVGDVKPVLEPGWTLNFEMYFYVIFTTSLFFSKRFFLPLLSTVLIGGYIAGLLFHRIPPIFNVATSPLLIEFLMGCFIGVLCLRREIVLHGYWCILLLLGGAMLLIATGIFETNHIPRMIKWGIPSAIIVTGAVLLEKNVRVDFHPLLIKLGDSSYSLYLTHIFTVNAVSKIWVTVFGAMYGVFTVVASICAMVAGYIAYRAIEKPLISYLNRQYAVAKANQLGSTA